MDLHAMTTRIALANSLRSRPGDYTKDARNINAYAEEKGGELHLRKRAAVKSIGVNIGANAQMFGTILDAHVGIGFSSSGSTTVSETSGAITSNVWTSSVKTTPANCSSITPSVSFLSFQGNGVSQYYRKSVKWRVEYLSGASWITTDTWKVVNIGDQIVSPVADDAVFTFPSAASWQFRIRAEAYNTNGTVFGSTAYTYSQTTVTAPNISPASYTTMAYPSAGAAAAPTFGAATGSGEIYQITYTATPVITAQVASGTYSGWPVSLAVGYSSGTLETLDYPGTYNHKNSGGTVIATAIASSLMNLSTTDAVWSPGAKTSTVSGSSLVFNTKYFELGTYSNNTARDVYVKLALTSISATIYRRTAIANSTTINNTYNVASYGWNISPDGTPSGEISDATQAAIAIVGDDLLLIDLGQISLNSFDDLSLGWDETYAEWGE